VPPTCPRRSVEKKDGLWKGMIPSGYVKHNYGKIHHAIHGKIHYFDWAIFSIAMFDITGG